MTRVEPRRSVVDDEMNFDLVARSPVNAMVTAGDGNSRMTWARRIHDGGGRRAGPFVAVFPGTTRQLHADDVADWFARATGGTLFIDWIGDLSSQAQDRLLRLLTEQSRHPDGATVPHADRRVCVVTGSNRSLSADRAVGAFSDPLFYRLNMIHIDLMHQEGSGEQAMKARDIMSEPAHTCGPTTDLATVAKIMWDHDCGFVPVVDASGAVTGVVTDRDICIAASTRHLLPEHISAAQVMTTPIHVCHSDATINDVLETMKQCRIRRVPVLDANGRLQGVISLNDIVLASTDKGGPKASAVVATMAAICAHRRVETAVV